MLPPPVLLQGGNYSEKRDCIVNVTLNMVSTFLQNKSFVAQLYVGYTTLDIYGASSNLGG